jgi:hypothetical protein
MGWHPQPNAERTEIYIPTLGAIKVEMAQTEDWAKLAVQSVDTVVQKRHGNVEYQTEDTPHRHTPQITVGVIHVAGLAHQAKYRKYLTKVDVLVLKGGGSHTKRGQVGQSTKNVMKLPKVSSSDNINGTRELNFKQFQAEGS